MLQRSPDLPESPSPSLVTMKTERPEIAASRRAYWRGNLLIMTILLAAWAIFAFVLPIFLVERLNEQRLGATGFPLGFWFGQQGSILAFVIIIFLYCALMNRLDKKHHREITALEGGER